MSDHGHDHATAARQHRGRLLAVLGIDVAIVVAEVVGAVVSHSLVLLADAGHMVTDVAGILLSLIAVWFAERPPTPKRTFGYQRAEILAAMANAFLLFGVSIFVIVEAVRRLTGTTEVATGVMLVFGVVAVLGNLASLLLLRHGQEESLNVRGAFLEVAADLLGALAVIVAALVIRATGYTEADAIASLLIGVLILPRTWRLLRDALNVLLETTPQGVELDQVRRHLLQTPGVEDVHDLHAWLITSGVPVLSAHVVVSAACLENRGTPQMLDRLQACLAGHFDIQHSTLQLEPAGHAEHEGADHP